MKKLLFLTTFLFISFSCKSQYDSIHSSSLKINGRTYLGKSESFLLSHFGKPSSKEIFFFEMDNIKGYKYTYNKIAFYVSEGKINSFEITGDRYTFINSKIKIGSNISALKELFPDSYKNRSYQNGITITLSDIDKFIVFEWDYFKIEKISVYDF